MPENVIRHFIYLPRTNSINIYPLARIRLNSPAAQLEVRGFSRSSTGGRGASRSGGEVGRCRRSLPHLCSGAKRSKPCQPRILFYSKEIHATFPWTADSACVEAGRLLGPGVHPYSPNLKALIDGDGRNEGAEQ
jgi:hypothetical protein